MRIGFVSFEYPPDSAYGGIATYVGQAARVLAARGHNVEVFSSSPVSSGSNSENGILVHRIHTTERSAFHQQILSSFCERHQAKKFDLIESPEYFGDGLAIKQKFPDLPLIVKLHTPDSFIMEMTNHYTGFLTKLRYIAGGVIRGKISQPFWRWKKKENDIEYHVTKIADRIHTPSVSLGDIVADKWNIAREKISNVPYPFVVNEKFLAIAPGGDSKTITFIGRLEIRKGVIELVAALKQVFAVNKNCRMRFVGRDWSSHIPGISMRTFIESSLQPYLSRIEFLQVAPNEIPSILADTSVCVFPSIWENFPNVCLEAMSAARAIVGSNQGGMKDMLGSPVAGRLVNPLDPGMIAAAIIEMLDSPALRIELGIAARTKVLEEYNSEVIGSLMETKYQEAIH